MRFIAKSSLAEYAHQFWVRESDKNNRNGIEIAARVQNGEDPIAFLREKHPYKLPNPKNQSVSVSELETADEVAELIVHDYMPNDRWMRERGLVPDPLSRKLGVLAQTCLDRGYFTSQWNDRQIAYYREWHSKDSIQDVIARDQLPLLEFTESGEIEIVDGWGRLLPVAALLAEGFDYEPIPVFFAVP